MPGRDRQAQQNLLFQQIQHIQMRFRQNAVEFFFLVVQRIQACLVAQQQPGVDPYRMIHRAKTTLATQPAASGHADIQQGVALLVHTAVYGVLQGSMRFCERILQARQSGYRHFTAYLSPIPGKIQTVDERPCGHEARMIYFSPLHVKNPKEYS